MVIMVRAAGTGGSGEPWSPVRLMGHMGMFSCSAAPFPCRVSVIWVENGPSAGTISKQSWALCFCAACCYRETGRRCSPPFPSCAVVSLGRSSWHSSSF